MISWYCYLFVNWNGSTTSDNHHSKVLNSLNIPTHFISHLAECKISGDIMSRPILQKILKKITISAFFLFFFTVFSVKLLTLNLRLREKINHSPFAWEYLDSITKNLRHRKPVIRAQYPFQL